MTPEQMDEAQSLLRKRSSLRKALRADLVIAVSTSRDYRRKGSDPELWSVCLGEHPQDLLRGPIKAELDQVEPDA